MKLRIEKWVEDTKPFSAPVNELFTEAVNNYKFGSYRSAFIMAYSRENNQLYLWK